MRARARNDPSWPELRSVILHIHTIRGRHYWSYIVRRNRGPASFDRRLHSGSYDLEDTGADPRAGLLHLAAALQAAFVSADLPWPEASRGPLGGVRGDPDAEAEAIEAAWSVSEADRAIDLPVSTE